LAAKYPINNSAPGWTVRKRVGTFEFGSTPENINFKLLRLATETLVKKC